MILFRDRPSWQFSERMPSIFNGQAGCFCCPATATAGYFYTGGVSSTGSFPNDLYSWTGSWTAKTAPPLSPTFGNNISFRTPCLTTQIGEFYLNQPWIVTTSTAGFDVALRYTTATDTWANRTGAGINDGYSPSSYAGIGNGAGIGWFFGGASGFELCTEYDNATDTWTAKTAPSSASGSQTATSAYLNSLAFKVGGNFSNECQAFDPSGNSWSNKATQSASLANRYGWTDFSGGQIFVAGGNSAVSSATECYSEAGNSWSSSTGMSAARSQGGFACTGDLTSGAVLGGVDSTPARVDTHYTGTPSGSSISWTTQTSLTSARLTTGCTG